MTLVMVTLRGATQTPSLLELLADGILSVLPSVIFSTLLDSMQQIAKPVMYLIMLIGQLLVGGAIGQWYVSHLHSFRVIFMVLGIWLLFGVALFPILGLGVFGGSVRIDPLGVAITALGGVLSYAAALLLLVGQLKPRLGTSESINRRRFVGWLGFTIAGTLVTLVSWRLGGPAAMKNAQTGGIAEAAEDAIPHGTGTLTTESTFGVTGLPKEITPTSEFFKVSKNLSFLDPSVDPRTWQLRVDGLVDSPLTLTYDDVLRLPPMTDFYTLQCISNEVGGELIGNAQWRGFRLSDLLTEARMKPGVVKVIFHCADDYQVSITPDRAMHPDTLAAYEMNGLPLTREHGAPLRIVVPGLYGMMNAKWVRRIELVKHDHKGYWQAKGWSDTATYQTTTRIDVPRNRPSVGPGAVTIGGIAFAGDRGVAAVEVSLDKGKTWHEAELKPPMSVYAWGLWRYTWTPEPGNHTIHARAIDGTGRVQPAEIKGPLPDGATGHHEVTAKVLAEPKPKAG